MVLLERIRNIHDDIVFRYLPEAREYAPLVLSGAFVLALATIVASALLTGTTNASISTHRTAVAYPTLGAELRLSRLVDRPVTDAEAGRALVSEADANDPASPMLVEIDPESGAVHASAGIIEVEGTPINVGNWPLD